MQWLSKARPRLRSFFRRSRVAHELDDELRFVKEECRDARGPEHG